MKTKIAAPTAPGYSNAYAFTITPLRIVWAGMGRRLFNVCHPHALRPLPF